jgi:hypothetical protein
VILGVENCVLLGYYAADSSNSLRRLKAIHIGIQLDVTLIGYFIQTTLHVSGIPRPSSGVLTLHGQP